MKRCTCGSEMNLLQDKGDGLTRYQCPVCPRSVTTTRKPGEAKERVRAQHGLGMKRTKWY